MSEIEFEPVHNIFDVVVVLHRSGGHISHLHEEEHAADCYAEVEDHRRVREDAQGVIQTCICWAGVDAYQRRSNGCE